MTDSRRLSWGVRDLASDFAHSTSKLGEHNHNQQKLKDLHIPRCDLASPFGRALEALVRAHEEEVAVLRSGQHSHQLKPLPSPPVAPKVGGHFCCNEVDTLEHVEVTPVGPHGECVVDGYHDQGIDVLHDGADTPADGGDREHDLNALMSSQGSECLQDPALRWFYLSERALSSSVKLCIGRRDFEVLDHWLASKIIPIIRHTTHNWVGQLANPGNKCTTGTHLMSQHQMYKKLALPPDSKFLFFWLLIGLLNLTWDAVTIPLYLADILPYSLGFDVINLVILVYWTFDVPLQFFTGFWNDDGSIELRSARIRRRYMRRRFWFDVPVLMLDYAAVILVSFWSSLDGAPNSTRIFRGIRFFRLIRLIRARSMRGAYKTLVEYLRTPQSVLLAKAMKYVAIILTINHYLACIWVGIGRAQDASNKGWLMGFGGADVVSPEYSYVLSLHWCLTQFSPSTQNIAPTTVEERAFACFVSLVAMLAFSSFISGITGAVNQLGLANAASLVEEEKIRSFLTSRGISTKLYGHIHKFFHTVYRSRQSKLREQDLFFFQQLPEIMRIEMHLEMFFEVVKSNDVFASLNEYSRSFFVRLCHQAMEERFVLEHQEIFIASAHATGMHAVLRGSAEYRVPVSSDDGHRTWMPRHSQVDTEQQFEGTSRIAANVWLAEMSLFTPWNHVGTLAALEYAHVVHLPSSGFYGVVVSHQDFMLQKTLRNMALLFVHFLQTAESKDHPVTDLPVGQPLLELTEKAHKFTELCVSRMGKDEFSAGRPTFGKF